MREFPENSEFEVIRRLFRPLSRGESGAYELQDDGAAIDIPPDCDLVITKDMMSSGTHFFDDDPPETLGRKLLRVNLSDLAAMGAKPRAYTMGLALPKTLKRGWLENFAEGLARDQTEFDISLIGGDTIKVNNGFVLSLTAFGVVPSGSAIRRSGARPGDDILVSGTVGDSMLGLSILREKALAFKGLDVNHLTTRYFLPEPRISLGQYLRGHANAVADISDGLVADLGHICRASRVGAKIDLRLIPLSKSLRIAMKADKSIVSQAISAGDDYELLICVDPSLTSNVYEFAEKIGIRMSKIGKINISKDFEIVGLNSEIIELDSEGFTHF